MYARFLFSSSWTICFFTLATCNVLFPDVYVSGIDIGLPSLCLWIPWYLQSQKAQRFDCLCDVGPTFILSLYLVGYRIDRLLVFGRVNRVPDVKGVAMMNSFLVGCLAALMGQQNFLAPSILGLASDMFLFPFSLHD
jgi:hypothetical protein